MQSGESGWRPAGGVMMVERRYNPHSPLSRLHKHRRGLDRHSRLASIGATFFLADTHMPLNLFLFFTSSR